MADSLEEKRLLFTEEEARVLRTKVIKADDVARIMVLLNESLLIRIDKDWLEALMQAFGLTVEGSIEGWLRSILQGRNTAVVKAVLGAVGILKEILIRGLRAVFIKVANELFKQQINALFKSAWETQIMPRILFQGWPRQTQDTVIRRRVGGVKP